MPLVANVEGAPADQHEHAVLYRYAWELFSDGRTAIYPRSSGLKVTQRAAGTNMTVDIAKGTGIVPVATVDNGSYILRQPATNKAIDPADSNPRNDIVGLKIEDSAVAGSNDTADVVVVKGTPAGSPVDPTYPANFVPLARVRVGASPGFTAVTNAVIDDLRSALWTAAHARMHRTSLYEPAGGFLAPIAFDTIDDDPSNMLTTGSAAGATVARTGRYLIAGQAQWAVNNAIQNAALYIWKNGSPVGSPSQETFRNPNTNDYQQLHITDLLNLTAGDLVQIAFSNGGAQKVTFVSAATFMAISRQQG